MVGVISWFSLAMESVLLLAILVEHLRALYLWRAVSETVGLLKKKGDQFLNLSPRVASYGLGLELQVPRLPVV